MTQMVAGALSHYVIVGYLVWGLIVGSAVFFSLGSVWELFTQELADPSFLNGRKAS